VVERVISKAAGGNYFSQPKTGIAFFSSGSKLLDLALGGGWAEQRIANIIGDSSTGKTLLMIEAAANFIKKYKSEVKYREAESAFDKPYAKALGMPIDYVDFGDDPLETVEDFYEDLAKCCTKSKHPTLYILDSLDALSDRSEMGREIDQGSFGANKAKQMSQLFRRSVSQLSKSKVTLLIVSQIRDKIGVTFGRKFERSGGKALNFYASQVIILAQLGRVTRTRSGITRPVAIKVKAKVDKNKISFPFREAEFRIDFGYGVNDIESCLEWLKLSKGLSSLNIKADKVKDFVDDLDKLNDTDYWSEVKRVYTALEKHWYVVEKEFLPTRKKYNGE
jgi:recombination protein RecA